MMKGVRVRQSFLGWLLVGLLGGGCMRPQSAPAQPDTSDVTMDDVYQAVSPRFDAEAAYAEVAFLMQYWRIGGGPGYDASLQHIRQSLETAGYGSNPAFRVSLLETPRGGDGYVWDPLGEAELALTAPFDSVLHRYEETPVMVVEGSPPGQAEAELVLDSAPAQAWQGRFVLTRRTPGEVYALAADRGAVGLLTDAIPAVNQPERYPDLIKYLGLDSVPESGPMAFSVSRRTADLLRAKVTAGRVMLRGSVRSRRLKAPVRTLVAEIEGALYPDERIVLVSHVDEPMANDNATGAATLTEVARMLAGAVQEGSLPAPARTLTMLWVEEYTSTYAYLASLDEAGVAGIRAAVVLDMVGEDMTKTGGTFLIERSPDPGALWTRPPDHHTDWGASGIDKSSLKGYFINDLYRAVADRRAEDTGWRVEENPWEGGSDHDPFLRAGIPAVLNWHFTDVFYHSSLDLLENVNPAEMENVGVTAATAAYLFSTPGLAYLHDGVARIEAAGLKRLKQAGALGRKALMATPGDASAQAQELEILDAWAVWYEEAVHSLRPLALPEQRTALQPAIDRALASLRAAHQAERKTLTS